MSDTLKKFRVVVEELLEVEAYDEDEAAAEAKRGRGESLGILQVASVELVETAPGAALDPESEARVARALGYDEEERE